MNQNQYPTIQTIESYTGKLKKDEKKRVEELMGKKTSMGKILNEIQVGRGREPGFFKPSPIPPKVNKTQSSTKKSTV